MMYKTVFRSIRASEILSQHSYTLRGYAMQRSIKEQLYILCAVANGFATIEEVFADETQGEADRTAEQEEKHFRAQLKIEGDVRAQICGAKSGLSEKSQEQLLIWERMFNKEVHRALFSFFRASRRLLIDGKRGMELVPPTDDLADSMFLNRSMELNWMCHRLLPFMRRADKSRSEDWDEKWKLLDESFAFMFRGFSALGKAIAPAYEEMLKAKFNFGPDTFYVEGKKAGAYQVKR